MAARAMWRAAITFGAIEIPVKMYAGARDTTVHFRLLHRQDLAPVKQLMVTDEGAAIASDTVQHGAVVGRGRFVLLTAEEIASVEPPASREIRIERFIPQSALDQAYYDRPYWLGPDGGNEQAYWALVEALGAEKREGIAHWVLRKRAYVGALRVRGQHLVLITVRHAGEVIASADLPRPGGRAADPRELAMARQLVAAMESPFDAAAYHDEYRARVMDLLERKGAGEPIPTAPVVTKRAAPNLEDALRKSLAAVGAPRVRAAAAVRPRRRPAKRRTARA
jgi:DNA end-binding protein Ku